MTDFEFRELTLDTYFDKIYYINLEKDILRNEHILNQFKRFGITNFERINAIVLNELPSADKYRNFIKFNYEYLIGSLSCKASHLQCFLQAKKHNFTKILILEDDVTFLVHPNLLLTKNMHILNEWDMLYFGGLIEPHFRGQIVGAYAYGVRNTLFDNILNMADASGMEIDNFYAKIIQHMSYNNNQSGRYNIRLINPFNQIAHKGVFKSNIQN